jgi:hypothetical protein
MYITADVISGWEQKLHESCTDVVSALISKYFISLTGVLSDLTNS